LGRPVTARAPGLLEQLITALRCLPGVGPKSAQRMAYHLLERDRDGGTRLGEVLVAAMAGIGRCASCRTLSENECCAVCADPRRDRTTLCVVETPADLAAIEAGTGYRGLYFVLMGRLSPLDGLGPAELGLDRLAARLAREQVAEVILATGATVEGQATAHYVGELARGAGARVSRIAQGVPLGGDLEHVDSGTLAHAFSGRQALE
jgi:recombination protein RecR